MKEESSHSAKRSHWPIVILSSAASLFAMLLPLVLVRTLTPDEVGHFKIFFLYLTIAPAVALVTGISSGLSYWAGRGSDGLTKIQSSAICVYIAAMLCALVILTAHRQLQAFLGWTDVHVALFGIAVFGAVSSTFFEEASIATGRIWTGALFYAGFELLRTIAIVVAVISFKTITAVLATHAAFVVGKSVIGFVAGVRSRLIRLVLRRDALQAVGRYALPVSAAWVFGIIVTYADQLILSTSIAPDEFALYAIGCLSIPPLLILEQSVTRILIPQMSEAFIGGRNQWAARLLKRAIESLAYLLMPSVVGLVIFAEPIIHLLFTEHYSGAATYLRLFALSYLFLIFPYDAVARAQGRSQWILNTFIVFSVVALFLAYVMTMLWGATGALGALLISRALFRSYGMIYIRSSTGLPFGEFIPFQYLAKTATLSIFLAVPVLASAQLFASDLMWFAIAGCLYGAVYLLAAFALRLRSHPAKGVLIITQSLNVGGLERMILNLSDELRRQRRWEVSVFAYDQSLTSDNLIEDFTARGIPIETAQKAARFSPFIVLKILRLILNKEISIVHSHDLGGLLYAVLAKIACIGQVKIVHTQHSFIHLTFHARYRLYEKALTHFVDVLNVVAPDLIDTYEELGFQREKISLIENGVHFPSESVLRREDKIRQRAHLRATEQPALAELQSRHSEKWWILYLARLFPGKGQEHALLLWNALPRAVRDQAVLCYVGPESTPGALSRLKMAIQRCLGASGVYYLGSSMDPAHWVQSCDIFLSCSEFEGMPLSPLEAAASGTPTILSDIPGHRFLGDIAHLFSLEDPLAGARHVQSILSSLQNDYRAVQHRYWNESARLRDHFSVSKMASQYANLYESLLEKPLNAQQYAQEVAP